MKKPKVEYISHEPFAVIKNNGEWLDSIETCEAYEKMIDALIEVHEYLKNLNDENGYKPSPMRDKINLLEKTLLKAGCKL